MSAASQFIRRTMVWLLLGCGVSAIAAGTAEAQTVTSKRCSRCQTFLPLSTSVGSTCPSCGAYFAGEQREYSGDGAGASPPSSPQELLWLLRLQQQMWEQQQRALEHEARTARMQEKRDKLVADREGLYERVRERTEVFRQQDDPERRAQRYIESAAACEAEGDLRAAAAYYRLAQRVVPNSTLGRKAAGELTRLQGRGLRP